MVGIINAYPLIGVINAAQLYKLYSVVVDETNLIILMRHRAILFGLMGGTLICAAFDPRLQVLAMSIGLISMISFVVLALQVRSYNAPLRRIVTIDVVASLVLGFAFVLYLLENFHLTQ